MDSTLSVKALAKRALMGNLVTTYTLSILSEEVIGHQIPDYKNYPSILAAALAARLFNYHYSDNQELFELWSDETLKNIIMLESVSEEKRILIMGGKSSVTLEELEIYFGNKPERCDYMDTICDLINHEFEGGDVGTENSIGMLMNGLFFSEGKLRSKGYVDSDRKDELTPVKGNLYPISDNDWQKLSLLYFGNITKTKQDIIRQMLIEQNQAAKELIDSDNLHIIRGYSYEAMLIQRDDI